MKNLTTTKLESTVGGCQWGDCPGTGPTIFWPPIPTFPFPIPYF